MRKLLINGEWHFPADDDELVEIIRSLLGNDTADALREIIDNSACNGECDATYEIGDHYKRVIRDIVDRLQDVAVYAKHKKRFDYAMDLLEAEL